MKYTTKQIGDKGEDYTAEFLINKGCKILSRNFRIRNGEIDIIAQKDRYILFVEVKTRHQNSMSKPCEAVDIKKQRRIINTAVNYLSENNIDLFCRFDVCEITVSQNDLSLLNLNYIKDAFSSEDSYVPY